MLTIFNIAILFMFYAIIKYSHNWFRLMITIWLKDYSKLLRCLHVYYWYLIIELFVIHWEEHWADILVWSKIIWVPIGQNLWLISQNSPKICAYPNMRRKWYALNAYKTNNALYNAKKCTKMSLFRSPRF